MLCDMLYDAADPPLCINDVLWGCVSTRTADLSCFYLRLAVISACHITHIAVPVVRCDVALRKQVKSGVFFSLSTAHPKHVTDCASDVNV